MHKFLSGWKWKPQFRPNILFVASSHSNTLPVITPETILNGIGDVRSCDFLRTVADSSNQQQSHRTANGIQSLSMPDRDRGSSLNAILMVKNKSRLSDIMGCNQVCPITNEACKSRLSDIIGYNQVSPITNEACKSRLSDIMGYNQVSLITNEACKSRLSDIMGCNQVCPITNEARKSRLSDIIGCNQVCPITNEACKSRLSDIMGCNQVSPITNEA